MSVGESPRLTLCIERGEQFTDYGKTIFGRAASDKRIPITTSPPPARHQHVAGCQFLEESFQLEDPQWAVLEFGGA